MRAGKILAGLGLAACLGIPSFSGAEELAVSGIGKAAITPNISVTREESLRNAKREAILAGVIKLIGPTAVNDPKVQAAAEQMLSQIGDEHISDQTNSRDAANNFVTRVTLKMDELVFRQILQAQGIASTAARNYPILVVMDEFFTTATDHQKPLRELVEYSSDQTATYATSHSESAAASSASAEYSEASYAGSGRYAASSASAGEMVVNGNYAAGAERRSASGSFQERAASASGSAHESSASSSLDQQVFDQKKDVVNFRKLVEYQPQNVGPEKQSFTYTALLREAGKYDLNILDNDLFRSKYFTGKPLTMEELQGSSELARYVAAARENKADYFMVGNSIIINNGKNAATGAFVCDGLVTIKSYSTEDGAVLATDSRSESASGNSPDQCRVNVANKLASFVGHQFGSTIQNYWRQRETFGREYTVRLVSLLGTLSEDHKDAFAEAIESIDGLQSKVIERKSTRGEYEVALTYKGDRSISREIGAALKKVDGFKGAGRKVEGTSIKVCLEGPCPEK